MELQNSIKREAAKNQYFIAWGLNPETFDPLDPAVGPVHSDEEKKLLAQGINPYTKEPIDYATLPAEPPGAIMAKSVQFWGGHKDIPDPTPGQLLLLQR